MSICELTPQILHRELAVTLYRSLFAELDQAVKQTQAAYSFGPEGMGIAIGARYADTYMHALVPEDALKCSLDHVSERYIKPAVQSFLFEVWETHDV